MAGQHNGNLAGEAMAMSGSAGERRHSLAGKQNSVLRPESQRYDTRWPPIVMLVPGSKEPMVSAIWPSESRHLQRGY